MARCRGCKRWLQAAIARGSFSVSLSALVWPVANALQVLSRFSVLRELKEAANLGTEHTMHFARAGEEELLAGVGMVEPLGGKVLV
jgi:hypothetical protein